MAALILGNSATALYAVRELGEHGIKVYVEGIPGNINKYSKYSNCLYSSNRELSESERLALIITNVPTLNTGKLVLIPCSDQDVEFIYRNKKKLCTKFVIQSSILSGLANKIMDKDGLNELCIENHIATPKSWTLEHQSLRSVVSDLSFPCIIKPSLIHVVKSQMAGKKLWVIDNTEQYLALVHKLPSGNTDWIIQEIIKGPESNIWLYSANFSQCSEPQQEFTANKLRQYPPGFGSASYVQSAENEQLKVLCRQFFKSIGYVGIAAAEFKYDSDTNELKIIEINPRPSLWFGITTCADKKLCWSLYCDLKDKEKPDEYPQLNGVTWRYWLKDMFSATFYRLNKKFTLPSPRFDDILKVTRATTPVFKTNDIRPFFSDIYNLVFKVITRVIRKVVKHES